MGFFLGERRLVGMALGAGRLFRGSWVGTVKKEKKNSRKDG